MPQRAVHRIEVRPRPAAGDPMGVEACRRAKALELSPPPRRIDTARVYLLEGPLDAEQVGRIAEELLCDPVTERAEMGAAPPRAEALIEIHPLPGVMDPDAEAVEQAIEAMLGIDVRVRTGRRFDMHGIDAMTARTIAESCLANTVIHAIHDRPYQPRSFPSGSTYTLRIITVPLRDLDDDALLRLSREAHLFLSLDEMKAIAAEYRRLDRDPTEIELETLAQTWSEHCVHKTLKSTIRYLQSPAPTYVAALDAQGPAGSRAGHEVSPDGSITIHNLLQSTIVAATKQLIAAGADWCLSVFVDNAGVIAFDDEHAVCFKVETHNHPSAIEPYGGAATGIGGCIRDIIGTGLAAKPVAATDVFCVAYPDGWSQGAPSGGSESRPTTPPTKVLPAGCLHPKRILRDVVAGVRDYGNRMGIPTLNGAVWFDDDYVGNPLVFCGCVGVMPRDKISGEPEAGDHIVAIGGRTGRDGIHGATFSSAALTDTHADEFSHAVQIGNAVTEKKLLDAILAARDHPEGCLFRAITDCGAGGFSSAVGEMGDKLGAEVHLERAALKYAGLSPTEIWISEAQERMVLAVPPASLSALRAICELHEVEMCELGRFGTAQRELVLQYDATEVGRLAMEFLHEGRPEVTRQATWSPPDVYSDAMAAQDDRKRRCASIKDGLLGLLSHPNIASKRWIIRQYDHEVQGGSVLKPLVGASAEGPSDAAVILPVAGLTRGLAIANGLATGVRDDPYLMALAAIDECVRNLVCVGADPNRIALLDNFSWPSCDDPEQLGALVRACEGCHDGAIAYRAPFISGKDSLNNQFTTDDGRIIRIPPTLLISGIGIVQDVRACVTMDAKAAGNLLVVAGPLTQGRMGGSHFGLLFIDAEGDGPLPAVELQVGPLAARAVHTLIERGLVCSAHDPSEGGLLVAAAEMAIGGELGLELRPTDVPREHDAIDELVSCWFCEEPSRYLLEVRPEHLDEVRAVVESAPNALSLGVIGQFNSSGRLTMADDELHVSIDTLKEAWFATLDW